MSAAGAWAPLRRPVFRVVWIAAFIANVGTWMQTVGGQWLLLEQHSSSLLVSLVQSASSLPVLLLVIPAGVVADFLDRRRLLLAAQAVQAVLAGLLAVLTAAGHTSPELLLAFTFLLGCGAAVQLPAYQSFVSDLLPRTEVGQGATLSSLGVNLARAVGPAIAGLLLAHLGVPWLFALNALSFVLFGAALAATPSQRSKATSGVRATSWSTLEAGGRYVTYAPVVRRILLRLVMFAVPANVLWALLAPLAERHLGLGASGYGILLAAGGVGAVAGALLLPLVRDKMSPSLQLTVAGVVYGAGLIALAFSRNLIEASIILLPVGVAWIAVIAGLNAATQAFLPDWVRARALSVYQMVLFATFAGSAAAWGVVTTWIGLGTTFAVAGLLLLATTVAGLWLPLHRTDIGDRTAVPYDTSPAKESAGSDDPLEIVVRYHVSPEHLEDFLEAIENLRTSRLRIGATHWALLRDAADPALLTERYRVASWADHLDQHERRLTPFDRQVEQRVDDLADAVEPARHLVFVPVPHRVAAARE
ncbi:MFS family permease [Actinoplanes lutulentus]|uniref:Putative MFS family arabinose efflux permease n=1 Tax=Actinoplanes lutulentus TaxID=1287878 RepID=A0A327Z3J8_9ACTN|nr:MFS transporter [Actinoplanes lutulentus]MBB2947787.1 MFS family permease [Actinoplanes lutulentus]RAK29899.1 putative MFS family arabinose efflux permease [Actinoplanes lutulentus]